jgi:hypothetical protein
MEEIFERDFIPRRENWRSKGYGSGWMEGVADREDRMTAEG